MLKRLQAVFYSQPRGGEPVREWLQTLQAEDRRRIGRDIAVVEFGWPIGMPVCRSLGRGLFEVRSNIADGRIARVIFVILGDRMILLHGFVKKAQKTPHTDLNLAFRRMKDFLS
ncbi:MAG: type II toxin-antitoxin system RelE/ParE family toxin [Pseudomonadota bacterium]